MFIANSLLILFIFSFCLFSNKLTNWSRFFFSCVMSAMSGEWWVIIAGWCILAYLTPRFKLEEIQFCPKPPFLDSKFTQNQISGFNLTQNYTSTISHYLTLNPWIIGQSCSLWKSLWVLSSLNFFWHTNFDCIANFFHMFCSRS